MSDYEVTCPICGTKYMGGFLENCPYCDWLYVGEIEDTDDIDDADTCNPLSIRQARENVAKGLNIWGDPLPKRK